MPSAINTEPHTRQDKADTVMRTIRDQNRLRGKRTINLIASENPQSPGVLKTLEESDFHARYAEGHANLKGIIRRHYQGTRHIDSIELMAEAEARSLFRAQQVDVRPISGNQANTAIALAWLRGGDTVVANSTDAGGHISHGLVGVVGRRIQTRGMSLIAGRDNTVPLHTLPLTKDNRYHIDVNQAIDLIEGVKPRMVILGKSLFLFPEPVTELAEVCREMKIPILYDGAHVLGLIAGGQFQDPLREGATWVTGSTHKTFPGTQRGIILGNLDPDDEKRYWTPADRGVFPGSSSNHHLGTLPGLVIATLEMQEHGQALAEQTIANAQALGSALDDLGISVEARDFGFTRSHQLALQVTEHGGGMTVAQRLERSDIIVNSQMLPGDKDPNSASGLRLGVQEMTRFGLKEGGIGELAQLIADAIRGKRVKGAVNRFRRDYIEMQYHVLND